MKLVLVLLSGILLLMVGCPGERDRRASRWDRKDAYRSCPAMIARFPKPPRPPCRALHLCANEARLDGPSKSKLMAMFGKLGCAPP